MTEKFKLKSSIKYPTSIIVRGKDFLAVEIAKSLIDQGGYVVVIDNNPEEVRKMYKSIENQKLLSIIDFSAIEYLDEDLRRLDYVFYLNHQYDDVFQEISSQEFLHASNYLDLMIKLAVKYEAKLLMSSSIRAHQLILNNTDIDMNFGKSVVKTQKVYTQLEIQRYAEALILESAERLNLDARITRLGHVIGEGMEFDMSNNFDRLVLQAAKGKDLEVYSDGLETNMYVHVLDAAYGVIKAMFAKGTSGNIYSVANEEEITDLSIAYKLQEMTGLSREIKFVDGKNSLPPIRFYKPAVSLSLLGWIPRISFTRALSQVLEYANKKINSSDEDQDVAGEDAEEKDDVYFDDEPKGALARLIAERKLQENARRGSILIANEKLRERAKNKRNLTRYEKLQRGMQTRYDSLAYKLNFLKRVTVMEAFFYLLLFVIFGVIYISLISPAFVIGREIVSLKYYTNQSKQALDNNNYDAFIESSKKAGESISTISDGYQNFEILYKITGNESKYNQNEAALKSVEVYTSSLVNSLGIISSFNEYWLNQDFGLVYTPNSTSVLSVSSSNENKDYGSRLKASEIKIAQAKDRLELAYESAEEKSDINFFGINLEPQINEVLALNEDINSVLGLVSTSSQLMFTDTATTYGIVVQDNSRYTPGGGYPSSIGFIKVQDGQILDIYLTPIEENSSLTISSLSASEVKQIELVSDTLVGSNVSLDKLFLVKDRATTLDDLKELYDQEYNLEPETFIFIDLQSLSSLLSIVGEVEINRVNIDSESLLTSIDLLQNGDNTINKRNEVITNVFAQSVINLTTNKSRIFSGLAVLNKAIGKEGIDLESLDYNLYKKFYKDEVGLKEGDWVEVRAAIDPQKSDVNVFSSLNMKVEDSYSDNLAVTRRITLTSANSVDLETVLICLPPKSRDFEFLDSGAVLGQSFSNNEICVVGDFTSSKNISFSYEFNKQIENTDANKYNIQSILFVTPGVDIVYDWDITLSPELSLVDQGNMILSNQKLITSGILEEDKTINFIVNK